MRRLVQINPVLRGSTSTGRIMQEIGDLAMQHGWESYLAYSKGRDGVKPCTSQLISVGDRWSVACHGLATRLFDRHGLASSGATRALVRRLEELKPDIVHIHNLHGYFLHYPTLFAYLAQAGIPVVWTVHDCWLYTGHCYYYSYIGCDRWERGCGHCPQRHKFPASWFFDRSARNFRDKRAAFTSLPPGGLTVVPVSDWIRGEMSRSFLKDCDFRVIHNGIDTSVFCCGTDPDTMRVRYGLEGKHVILGVASIWSDEKGLADFCRLAGRLQPDEVIVLVGVSEKLKAQLPAGMVGVTRTENVHQLAELYSLADVFVNPTWQDNYPTVNLEAIACGTPVVTYRTGGSVEAVTPETGLIVPQGDMDGLVDAVRTVRRNGKAFYRDACRSYALANFRKEDRYADYLRLYEELLRRKERA